MYFVLSKTVGLLAIPSNLIVLLAVTGAVLMGTRFVRAGRALAVTAIVLLAIAAFSPLGNALILPLEQRFPRWHAGQGTPDGIVVLGGAIGPEMSAARGEASLNESAERMTVVASLARQFPQARLVFSGGDASLIGDKPSEAMFVVPVFESFGIPASRIEL
jgi:uncharacterized SAM-binding protein YcdF (DUF218 family)